jgi:predicted transcriptional regulator
MGLSATSSQFHKVSRKSTTASSPQSYLSPKRTHALLSIKPKYAEAIFRGEKQFEFRRVIFRRPVKVVVLYTTSPVSRVAGEFDVNEIISDSVEGLWKRTKHRAGIDRKFFFEYFAGQKTAHAIAIGSVRRYSRSFDIFRKFGIRAPQSFAYLSR